MASIVPVLRLTEKEYLDEEKMSEVRHEYLGGMVYAMSGASEAHNLITLTLASRLRAHLRGKGCKVFMAEMKVRIEASGFYYYPDVMVTCDPSDDGTYFKTKPTLIIEVTSPSTAVTDRREKALAYQGIASLREYVIVSQSEASIQLYKRDAAGRWWIVSHGLENMLELESIGLNIPLTEIYEDVQFPEPSDEEDIS